MENGLGRTGYLLLATIMLVLGLLGIGTAYLAYLDGVERFFRMGLGLAAVALVSMFGFAAWAPWLAGPPRAPKAPKAEKPTEAPKSVEEPAPAQATRDLEFEYPDAAPAPRAAPEALVIPQAFEESAAPMPHAARDPAAWPERRTKRPSTQKSDWTARVEREAKAAEMLDSSKRRDMQERYTEDAPMVRGILQDPPMHVAERAPQGLGPGFTAPGMSVGQCGRCKAVVMAPDQRPLRLKCPECAKVTLLN